MSIAKQFSSQTAKPVLRPPRQSVGENTNTSAAAAIPGIKPATALQTPLTRKRLVSLRLDEDIIAAFKATGRGWQTRINATLRAAMP